MLSALVCSFQTSIPELIPLQTADVVEYLQAYQFLPSAFTLFVSNDSMNIHENLWCRSVLVPLFGSVVLWASNGEFPVKFIDALFICISGATGTGLQTVDLSSLTPFQRSVLALLEFFGNQVSCMLSSSCSRSSCCLGFCCLGLRSGQKVSNPLREL